MCAQTLSNGHLFERVDDPTLSEFFAHEEIDKLLRHGVLTHEANYFTAGVQTVLSHAEVISLAALPEKERIETLRRFEYVRRFHAHERAWAEAARKKRRKRSQVDEVILVALVGD